MMRRKLLLIIVLLSSLQVSSTAQVRARESLPRVRFGVEWGYTQCFFLLRDYNFLSDEGYRVYDRTAGLYWRANAQIMGKIGYPLSDRSLLSLCGGYMGIGTDNRLFPFALRYSFHPRTYYDDGIFCFAQGGLALHVHTTAGQTALLAAAGGGYRFRLSYDCNLDLLVSLKYVHDHPALPDPEWPGNVPERNIRKNIAGYCALDFAVSVSF